MYHVAASLVNLGFNLTCVDYSDEMVEFGRKRLPSSRVIKADLRDLPFEKEFDIIFVIGRVFTHMISDEDLSSAIQACWKSLRSDGTLLADNYEDIRIQHTSYFNGLIEGISPLGHISRRSRTESISDSPRVVKWFAEYSGTYKGEEFQFEDSMPHRAFSRSEFKNYLETANFEVLSQGDNFDETSFFTLARKK